MFKPFLTKSFALTLLIMVGSALFWSFQVYSLKKSAADREAARVSVLMDSVSDFKPSEEMDVRLEDCKPYGDGFTVDRTDYLSEYQAVVSSINTETPSSQDVVIVYQHRKHSKPSLWEFTSASQIPGYWYAPSDWNPDEEPELVAAFEEHYPTLDCRDVAFLSYSHEMPAMVHLGLAAFAIGSALMIPGCFFWTWQAHKKNEKWLNKINEDRTSLYSQHQHAMRLVTEDRYAASHSGPTWRRVDPTYDVANTKESKMPNVQRIGMKLIELPLVLAAGIGFSLLLAKSSFLSQLLGGFTDFISVAGTSILVGVLFKHFTAKKLVESAKETPITVTKAKYRERGFHQYHDKVLKELGFTEIGDYHLAGGPQPLARTIYFSRQGNVMVEVGLDAGREFFTIESLTTNENFLETHSLLGKSQETRDPTKCFQRRSAKHQDIVLALETHDQLVAEYTSSGSTLEAQFTEEKFPRFLVFGQMA